MRAKLEKAGWHKALVEDDRYLRQLEALHLVQLDLLAAFDRVCRQQGLCYCAVFGTLLGAVRHGGFIPWDDDIDLAMPRQDYERLKYVSFPPPYFLQTPDSDPDSPHSYIQLCNEKTTCANPVDMAHGYHKGCHIDILPVDGIPEDMRARHRLHRQIYRLRGQLRCKAQHQGLAEEILAPRMRHRVAGLAGQSVAGIRAELEALSISIGPEAAEWGILGTRKLILLPREAWWHTARLPFAGLTVPAPRGHMDFLRQAYGDITLPRETKRQPKHEALMLDTRRGWREYASYYTDIFRKIADKELLLFGAGEVSYFFMQKYGQGRRFAALFDNDPKKWGGTIHGLPVKNPAELPALLRDDGRALLVTSIYAHEIIPQLEGMGIQEFCVYFDGKDYSGELA